MPISTSCTLKNRLYKKGNIVDAYILEVTVNTLLWQVEMKVNRKLGTEHRTFFIAHKLNA